MFSFWAFISVSFEESIYLLGGSNSQAEAPPPHTIQYALYLKQSEILLMCIDDSFEHSAEGLRLKYICGCWSLKPNLSFVFDVSFFYSSTFKYFPSQPDGVAAEWFS